MSGACPSPTARARQPGRALVWVVPGAQALAVAGAGPAAEGHGDDVVVVADRRIAEGEAADPVPGAQEATHGGREVPSVGIDGDHAPRRVGEDPAQPRARPRPVLLTVAAGVAVAAGIAGAAGLLALAEDQLTREGGGKGAVSGQGGRMSPVPSRASGSITSCTSTGTSSAHLWPVSRSTKRSAMSWPRPRSSPAALIASASRRSAAQAATPCSTGSRPVTQAIVSGWGRDRHPRVGPRPGPAAYRRLRVDALGEAASRSLDLARRHRPEAPVELAIDLQGLIRELTEVWADAEVTPPEGTRPD